MYADSSKTFNSFICFWLHHNFRSYSKYSIDIGLRFFLQDEFVFFRFFAVVVVAATLFLYEDSIWINEKDFACLQTI